MASPRKLGYLEKFKDLKPGDILLFRPSKKPFKSQETVKFFQILLSLQHGHYDTIHVAVCVAIENGQPVIAHTYEMNTRKDSPRGYFRQPLQAMLDYENGLMEGNGDRPFLVFRPKNQAAAKVVADIAGDEKANCDIKWTYKKAIRTYFRPAFWRLDENRPFKNNKSMPKEAICSQFVINAIKLAEQQRFQKGETILNRITIRSSSTPKALESCLYNDRANYDLLVYPGQNAYWVLMSAIRMQLQRVRKRCDELAHKKYQDGIALYHKIRKEHKKNDKALNFLDKSLDLLRAIMPILNRHTGFSFFGLCNTASYNKVRDKARQMGIFERDIAADKGFAKK
jgi:hypothetical protein